MSSQDSIGTMMKCIQNGAVDFLVKPVRKNELHDLGQHVYNRYADCGRSCLLKLSFIINGLHKVLVWLLY
jgi:DNA-binding response OmpR family regulator